MNNVKKAPFSTGRQYGDQESAVIVDPIIIHLRDTINCHVISTFCDYIDEYSFIHRVDGKVAAWHKEGCEKLRLMKSKRYITVDIMVPENRWRNKPNVDILNYLIECMTNGLNQMLAKLSKCKITVDCNALLNDYGNAIQHAKTTLPTQFIT